MIKGKIEMSFDETGTHIDVDVELPGGMASKCFIIDALCQALHLEGNEKIEALSIVTIHEGMKEE